MSRAQTVAVATVVVALGASMAGCSLIPSGGSACARQSSGAADVRPDPDLAVYPRALGLSSDGATLAVSCAQGTCLVDTATGTVRSPNPRFGDIALSPDAGLVGMGSSRGCVRVIDAGSGAVRHELDGHRPSTDMDGAGGVGAVAFAPDGSRLASVADDHTVRLWSVDDGAEVAVANIPPGGHRALAYSADGSRLAVLTDGQPVTVLDGATFAVIGTLGDDTSSGFGLAYDRSGRLAVPAAGQVRVFGSSGGQDAAVDVDGVPGGLAFAPDGATLAVTEPDASVVVLVDVASGTRRELRGHTDAPYAVAFSPDGSRLYSASAKEGIVVWNVGSGARVATWRPEA